MNKSYFHKILFCAILSFITFIAFGKQQKVVQIFRNGEIIQEYNTSDIDYIEVNDLIPAPEGVIATISNSNITIKWNPVEGALYNVYRSSDNLNFSLLASGLMEAEYTDVNPLRGANYYRIKAVVGDAESHYSASVVTAPTSSELESGLYLGIIGFNQALYPFPIDRLTEDTSEDFDTFINSLTIKNGTLLYYSVDQALDALQAAQLPDDVSNAALVTFTDGLDQGSMMKDVPYNDDMSYLNALNERIKNETVSGQPITAFSIGIRGKDVVDTEMFRSNLAQLASEPSNATEVTSMAEVNAKFQEIASQLSQSNYIQTISLKIPGISNGALVRFTFDNVSSAAKSKLYIEGIFNLKDRSLENVKYVGLSSSSGDVIKGTVDGIFVNFSFENVQTEDNTIIRKEFTDEWTYITSNSSWQINSEFDKTENTDIITERRSAVIMLVLDCSSSLAGDFLTVQSNAKDFIHTLSGSVNNENPDRLKLYNLNANDATNIVGVFTEEIVKETQTTAAHYQPLYSLSLGGFTFEFSTTNTSVTSAPAYYYATSANANQQKTIRIYKQTTMTITAPNGENMTSINFKGSNGRAGAAYTVSNGAITFASATAATWTGSTNSLTIIAAENFRISELEITTETY